MFKSGSRPLRQRSFCAHVYRDLPNRGLKYRAERMASCRKLLHAQPEQCCCVFAEAALAGTYSARQLNFAWYVQTDYMLFRFCTSCDPDAGLSKLANCCLGTAPHGKRGQIIQGKGTIRLTESSSQPCLALISARGGFRLGSSVIDSGCGA